jgi:DNA repair photolyase
MRRTDNPDNRFATEHRHWDDDEHVPLASLEVIEEHAKSIVSENQSPDVPFRYSANPYRGCYHACAYCYARPTHQYWGFGAGTDFDRKIIVKVNAPELLRERFAKRDWKGERIAFSGNTDCYQPLEAARRLTRACLEICAEHRNPVGIITKSALVQRDVDVLQALAQGAQVRVFLSIPFARDEDARAIEPGASVPSKRFAALAALSAAGIETGIAIAPIIPGLNDANIPELLQRAKDAGVRHAFMIALRLPAEVAPVFESRLEEAFPARKDKVMNALLQIRMGKKNDAGFGSRMRGQGPRWRMIEDLFALHCERLGLDSGEKEDAKATFTRPARAQKNEARGRRGTREDEQVEQAEQVEAARQLRLF